MREIKFRCWDTHQERFSNDSMFFASATDGSLQGKFRHPVFIEQYTGLKDKNGVEIYEGDIIAVPYCESVLSYGPSVEVGTDVYEVFWDTDMLRWELRETGGLHGIDGLCDYDESDIDVIGNIHENPGLLK